MHHLNAIKIEITKRSTNKRRLARFRYAKKMMNDLLLRVKRAKQVITVGGAI